MVDNRHQKEDSCFRNGRTLCDTKIGEAEKLTASFIGGLTLKGSHYVVIT